jgi:hypothetical protein
MRTELIVIKKKTKKKIKNYIYQILLPNCHLSFVIKDKKNKETHFFNIN